MCRDSVSKESALEGFLYFDIFENVIGEYDEFIVAKGALLDKLVT